MQRALAGTDFENPPAATDVQAVEQRMGHRVPQARLRSEPRRFVLRVTEKIFVGSRQRSCGPSVRCFQGIHHDFGATQSKQGKDYTVNTILPMLPRPCM